MKKEKPEIRLGVNIDHVATLRNARGASYPEPLRMASLLEELGVDGITVHLREDRRHIIDSDVFDLRKKISLPINLEMAATKEMQSIALRLNPRAVCLVPERREERTTEGGLDVLSEEKKLRIFIKPLLKENIRVSIFVSASLEQIKAAFRIGAQVIELNTGRFCDLFLENNFEESSCELIRLKEAAHHANQLGLEVHGGHGLSYDTVKSIAAIPEIRELNIGHFLVSEAIFDGIPKVISRMQSEIYSARKLQLGL